MGAQVFSEHKLSVSPHFQLICNVHSLCFFSSLLTDGQGQLLCLWVRGDLEYFQLILLFFSLISTHRQLLSFSGILQHELVSFLRAFPAGNTQVFNFCILLVRQHWVICFSSPKMLLMSFCRLLSPLPFSSFLEVYSCLYSSLMILLVFQEVSENQKPGSVIPFKFNSLSVIFQQCFLILKH